MQGLCVMEDKTLNDGFNISVYKLIKQISVGVKEQSAIDNEYMTIKGIFHTKIMRLHLHRQALHLHRKKWRHS